MPFKVKRNPHENIIVDLLIQKGYTRNTIRQWFSNREDGRPVSYETISRWLCNPGKYLTIGQVELIAGRLEMPLIEVLGLILGMNRQGAKKWYEANKEAFK